MRYFPLGESALTVDFGRGLSNELNDRALTLTQHFAAAPFPGLIEAVPAYSSVTLFYEVAVVRSAYPEQPSASAAVLSLARNAVEDLPDNRRGSDRLIEIPMIVSDDTSPDLRSMSERTGIGTDEIIEIFVSRTYRVYMLGFLPGFAYMGEVDERIATPRLSTPRTRVPKGSVGIAGKQSGVYPLDSPGGWNIIGRTDLTMFDPERAEPCLLRAGDEVRFVRQ
jgi:inhibitor of KinA